MSYEKRFLALDGIPPEPSVPPGCNYIPYRIVGKTLYLAGNGPLWGPNIAPNCSGKVWKDLTVAQGAYAARLTCMNQMLVIRQAIGTLDNVDYIISVDGLVQCTDDFIQQPTVIDGCSDLLVYIFGDAGKHTRTASGTNSLAFNIAVEISMIVAIK